MAGDVSFDVVSDFDEQELRNALDQVRREVGQRYDFKGVTVDLTQAKDELVLVTDDEYRAAAVKDLIESKAIRRNLSLKIFDWGKVEPAGGNKVRQEIKLRRGLPDDVAKRHHQAHPRRVPQGQVADPGRRGARLGQEQGRAPEGHHPPARARRGRSRSSSRTTAEGRTCCPDPGIAQDRHDRRDGHHRPRAGRSRPWRTRSRSELADRRRAMTEPAIEARRRIDRRAGAPPAERRSRRPAPSAEPDRADERRRRADRSEAPRASRTEPALDARRADDRRRAAGRRPTPTTSDAAADESRRSR